MCNEVQADDQYSARGSFFLCVFVMKVIMLILLKSKRPIIFFVIRHHLQNSKKLLDSIPLRHKTLFPDGNVLRFGKEELMICYLLLIKTYVAELNLLFMS